jgi:hypothetical protein
VDGAPIDDDAGTSFDRGHQFTPARRERRAVMLLYYDTRLDHTSGMYEPTPDYPDLQGRFYLETRAPVGEWAPPGQLEPDTVFTPRVDGGLTSAARSTCRWASSTCASTPFANTKVAVPSVCGP